jgi:nicotinamidase-related amidase
VIWILGLVNTPDPRDSESNIAHDPSSALLIIDPFNDFLSEGGKFWPTARPAIESANLINNLLHLRTAARAYELLIVIVPHRRFVKGQHDGWRFLSPGQEHAMATNAFEKGSWGGEFRSDLAPEHGDVVASEHWSQNGFVNTDLDLQLRMREISHVAVTGMVANTCVESTARFAGELGYHVTIISDAVAAWTHEETRVMIEVTAPSYANRVMTTEEFLAQLSTMEI